MLATDLYLTDRNGQQAIVKWAYRCTVLSLHLERFRYTRGRDWPAAGCNLVRGGSFFFMMRALPLILPLKRIRPREFLLPQRGRGVLLTGVASDDVDVLDDFADETRGPDHTEFIAASLCLSSKD